MSVKFVSTKVKGTIYIRRFAKQKITMNSVC